MSFFLLISLMTSLCFWFVGLFGSSITRKVQIFMKLCGQVGYDAGKNPLNVGGDPLVGPGSRSFFSIAKWRFSTVWLEIGAKTFRQTYSNVILE